jgi:thiol-disulfide isomerase/thioredoxin
MRPCYFSGLKLTVAVAMLVLPLVACSALSLPEPPAIGEAFPNFELPDFDGKTHTLEKYLGNIVVLEMASMHCPYSRGTDPHLVELATAYADKDVVVVGIDSHNSTTVEDIKKYAAEVKKTYPILKDEGNKYADVIGAKVTPEIYVIDKEGKLVYHGAFDDRADPTKKGENAYTENAVKAALEGKPANPDRVKAWGCSIKRK